MNRLKEFKMVKAWLDLDEESSGAVYVHWEDEAWPTKYEKLREAQSAMARRWENAGIDPRDAHATAAAVVGLICNDRLIVEIRLDDRNTVIGGNDAEDEDLESPD